MIGIVCLDLKDGMFFNNRRQSKDRYVIRDIWDMIKDKKLFMTEYSYQMFQEAKANTCIITDDYKEAGEEDYCFFETEVMNENKVTKYIVYRWDKVYPSDYKLDLSKWQLVSTLEFQGYSHEKILKEVYVRDECQKC